MPICISGDFNVHLDVSDVVDTVAFADLLESLSYSTCKITYTRNGTYFGSDNYSQL